MSAIPEKQAPTPEQLQTELSSWYILHKQLAELKTLEITKRKLIAPLFFPDPKEGTNRKDVGFGFDLVLLHKFNYNVDAAALDASAAALRKAGIRVDELFEYAPRLVMSKYRALNDKQLELLSQVVTITPATPSLSIVPISEPSPEEIGMQPVTALVPQIPAPPVAPESAAPPVPVEYILSPLAGNFTEEDFIKQGWTREQLIDAGYLIAQEPETGPAAPKPKPKGKPGRPRKQK